MSLPVSQHLLLIPTYNILSLIISITTREPESNIKTLNCHSPTSADPDGTNLFEDKIRRQISTSWLSAIEISSMLFRGRHRILLSHIQHLYYLHIWHRAFRLMYIGKLLFKLSFSSLLAHCPKSNNVLNFGFEASHKWQEEWWWQKVWGGVEGMIGWALDSGV